MSNSRLFFVEAKEGRDRFQPYVDEVNRINQLRKDELKGWGSWKCYLDWAERAIVSIKLPDGADYAEYKAKGWIKAEVDYVGSKKNQFVQPGASKKGQELRKWLDTMTMPSLRFYARSIIEEISSKDVFNADKLKGVTADKWWYSAHGQHYMGRMRLQIMGDQWFLIVPDDTLRYDSLEGLREVKPWEYDKAIEEYNARVKVKDEG